MDSKKQSTVKKIEYNWICDYCEKKFDSKIEAHQHELFCNKKDKEIVFKLGIFKKIILTLGCFLLPFLEALVVYMYTSETSSRLKMHFPLAPEVFLIGLFIITLFFNIFVYFKFPKKRFEIIYFSALIIGFPMICFCCYLLFYYFPFVHTPKGMGTVVQIYTFISFVFFIFLIKQILKKIFLKKKQKK